ncbi:hypothetical protein SK128_009307 [Halocaridina rubra]|uniref:C2H2-type domain-containing protein n=1 Tax=Halocaridina rubra TaxID=373956 RepID=A0AAN9AA63_HALRR
MEEVKCETFDLSYTHSLQDGDSNLVPDDVDNESLGASIQMDNMYYKEKNMCNERLASETEDNTDDDSLDIARYDNSDEEGVENTEEGDKNVDENGEVMNGKDDNIREGNEDMDDEGEKRIVRPEVFDFLEVLTSSVTDEGNKVPRKTFNCEICHKTLNRRYRGRHMKLHKGIKNYVCSYCGKAFHNKSNLNRHLVVHTEVAGRKDFPCGVCGKEFSSKSSLKVHMLSHTGEKQYKCTYCKRAYYLKTHWKTHMMAHEGFKNFSCKMCDKKFAWKTQLDRHMVVHTGVKSFKCEICGKGFDLYKGLRTHLVTHTSENKFTCETCGKTFKTKSNMICHMVSHSVERPYECSLCGMRFKRKSDEKQHQGVHRKQLGLEPLTPSTTSSADEESAVTPKKTFECERKFPCQYCSKAYFRRPDLNSHMLAHHTKALESQAAYSEEHMGVDSSLSDTDPSLLIKIEQGADSDEDKYPLNFIEVEDDNDVLSEGESSAKGELGSDDEENQVLDSNDEEEEADSDGLQALAVYTSKILEQPIKKEKQSNKKGTQKEVHKNEEKCTEAVKELALNNERVHEFPVKRENQGVKEGS